MQRAHAAATAIIAVSLAGCLGPREGPDADVLATFYPLEYVAARLAEPNVTVAAIVPGGIEPHDWEPTPRDATRLAAARVVVAQGLGFEPWLASLLENLGDRAPRVADATSGLGANVRRADDGTPDPHAWLDPLLLLEEARAVEAGLAAAWPQHAPAFAERGALLARYLTALHDEYDEGLTNCAIRVAIASHDAFSYLAARHNLTIEAIAGLAPESEPDPRTVARLVDTARAHDVRIVFFEEAASREIAEIIAREAGAESRVLSPVEGLTAEARAAGEDYFKVMRANLVNLREALRCA